MNIEQINLPLEASLRLWSDDIPLTPVIDRLGLQGKPLHVRGQPMTTTGRLAGRLAPRHYASLANARLEANDLNAWLRAIIDKVKADGPLGALIGAGDVEGTMWLAFLRNSSRIPDIAPATVEEARGLGLSVLLEDYMTVDELSGQPKRTWLVKARL